MKTQLVGVMLLLLAVNAMAVEQLRVTVLDASSANYLKVQTEGGETRWVRLAGVLCDEPETFYGKEARRMLLDRIQGKKVRLKLGGMDENGIRTAEVFYRSRELNALLLREGICQVDPEASPNTFLERAQKIAMVRKKGRWGPMPSPVEQNKDVIDEPEQESDEEGGFDNQSFMYTISGMGFLALMIMISRKRAIALKKAKREKEMAELIRQKNEEAGPSVIPVDLTSNVLMAPRRAPQHQPQPASSEETAAQCRPCDNDAESTEAGETNQDPLLASLTAEEKKLLEDLDEEERQKVLETLREQYGVTG